MGWQMEQLSNPGQAKGQVIALRSIGRAPSELKAHRLIGLAEVERRCNLKKTAIYGYMKAGRFPKNIKLPNSRSVAWLESDIDAYIAAAVAAQGALLAMGA